MSGFALKIIALVIMTIDHVGAVFEDVLRSDIQLILRSIGRVSFPIYAFNVGIGLQKTKDLNKFIIRLGVFAALTHIPYMIAVGGSAGLNVMFTFLGSAVCVLVYEKMFANKESSLMKALSVIIICLILYLCERFKTDYGLYGAALPLLIYFSKNKPLYLLFTALFIYATYSNNYVPNRYFAWAMISLIFIALYNNKKGALSLKYLFYVYYPLHFAVIWAIHKLVVETLPLAAF
jgi:hypothetical protein